MTVILRLLFTALIFVLSAGSSIAESALSLSATERAWLAAHPVIRIGVDPDYAPYAFVNEQGQADGAAAEITALVAKRLGLQLKLVPGRSWSQIIDGARQGDIDLIIAVSHAPQREAFLNFSQPYLSTPLVVLTRTETPRLEDLALLQGQRVALAKDHASTAQAAQHYPQWQVVNVTTPLEGLRAVSEGRAEAFVGELGVNTMLLSDEGITNVKVNTGFDMSNGQRYGVRKDWPELVPLMEKALASIP
ncbi:transporter substrate-binding domain-containing protein [Rhodoferax sp. PAMC 29310]|uniref:transporter substrate-binding domain-containing protein n=1 Tax=Rhodoferax sp. PAMC 29310 TaxID=2822760 RepID=UPI001B31C6D1|nr:transporter substrate-binding domain-containing protein [Rhodoferax sp. PAMC 29310]